MTTVQHKFAHAARPRAGGVRRHENSEPFLPPAFPAFLPALDICYNFEHRRGISGAQNMSAAVFYDPGTMTAVRSSNSADKKDCNRSYENLDDIMRNKSLCSLFHWSRSDTTQGYILA